MKRGYAVSGMLYTILVLFMALLLSFLYTMQNKKNILDKLKTEVVEAFYCSKADNIEDLRGATVIATSVKQEGDNALIQLPKEGRYDTTSYLSVPMSEISSDFDSRTILVKKGVVQDNVSITLSSATYEDGYILLTSNGYVTITADLTNFTYVSMSILGYGNIPKIRIDGGSNNLGSTLDISSYTGEHTLTFLTNGSDKIIDIWLE